ncbi:hypothetical protein K0M31_000147 [Melipona bicolor]|uniref:Uncharacterized protein n=1 Tax=Melipona bicolor TaxID=60889 RepID=A0AA40KWG4_9HYME|nr:hypothetical protein K0M31_000147 [Melipona bicolor]
MKATTLDDLPLTYLSSTTNSKKPFNTTFRPAYRFPPYRVSSHVVLSATARRVVQLQPLPSNDAESRDSPEQTLGCLESRIHRVPPWYPNGSWDFGIAGSSRATGMPLLPSERIKGGRRLDRC